jgi:hypothetical protein
MAPSGGISAVEGRPAIWQSILSLGQIRSKITRLNARRGRQVCCLGWRIVTDHRWIAPALAANPSTPEDLLLRLAGTDEEQTQLALIKARRYLPMSLPLATVLSDSPHSEVRCELAICTYLPDEVIIKLAADPQRRVRLHVVIRPEEVIVPSHRPRLARYAPDEAYAILARDEDKVIQREILESWDVPVRIKRELAQHAHLRDRVLLRYGQETDARAAYERMVADGDSTTRRVALTSDRFRPPARLIPHLLGDDENRLEAIRRIPLSADLAQSLTADEDPRVRQAVAVNPDLSRNLLDVLAADPDPDVRWALIHRPRIPMEVLDATEYDLDPRTRTHPVQWLWEQQHNRALVAEYARSRHVVYRRTVAHMPELAAEVVDHLATDKDYAVRLMLAESNGGLVPVDVLVEMLLTWDGKSSYEIARNSRIPDAVIDQLSRSKQARHRWLAHYSGRLTEEQRTRLAHDPDTELAAASNPLPPPTRDQLRQRLNDPSPDVRAAAARHPDLSQELIQELWRQTRIPTD